MSTTLSVRLPDPLAKRLASVSTETERTKSFHIQKALEMYLAEQAELQIGLDRLHDVTDETMSLKQMKDELGH